MDTAGFRYFLIRMIYPLLIKFIRKITLPQYNFSFGKHRLGIADAFFCLLPGR